MQRAGWLVAFSLGMTALGCAAEPRYQPRMQAADNPLPPIEQPPIQPPPSPQRAVEAPPPGQVTTTSLSSAREQRAAVRAHVNGRPIFDYEIMNLLGGAANDPSRERLYEAYNKVLQTLIDKEVIYQEAVRKIEKVNAKILEKLRDAANLEFEKKVAEITAQGLVSPDQLKELLPTLKRYMERELIYQEYMRSRIRPMLDSSIGFMEIRDYYDQHKNEFVRLDTVEWQDVFLAVGPKYATLAHARRAAEDLIAQVRTPQDFARLIALDDGDSRLRGGKGLGSHKGEIRPAEIEEYLFRMRDGEIGPIVELETGVHIFRLVKREYGGQVPLNEKVQTQIRNKLQNQLADAETRRIVRELRARSVIEIERQ